MTAVTEQPSRTSTRPDENLIVEARGIVKEFPARNVSDSSIVKALRSVDFSLARGEAAALIGESGCGKTTLGRILVGLETPTSGQLFIGGVDTAKASAAERKRAFQRLQMVHQDPYSALNPASTIEDSLRPALLVHAGMTGIARNRRGRYADERIVELLELVGLDPASVIDKYPHKLSGGQRQRVCIARSLITEPDVLIADEAVSMIDVSLRLGILNVFKTLRQELGVALLFITHDVATARYIGPDGTVHVIYRGRVVEQGPTDEIIQHPVHPYTQCLLSAIPVMRGVETDGPDRLFPTAGPEVHRTTDGDADCAFARRCPLVQEACHAQIPPLTPFGEADGHDHRCLYPQVRNVLPQPAVVDEDWRS